MPVFEVHAYEEGCHYSTKVMKLFAKAMENPYDLVTYERFGGNVPPNKKLPTMPRVFFKGKLVGGCDNVFDASQFIREKLQEGSGWTERDTSILRGKLVDSSSFEDRHIYHLIEAMIPLAKKVDTFFSA